ncbi:MAG: nuclear transport factor 2 family protein [Acidimicrobiales bacterium]
MTDTATTDSATVELLDVYFAMWREADAATRTALVERAFTADGRHVDPLADAHGHTELNDMVSNVHAHYPGFSIERTSGIDQHGDQLRFAWKVDLADGTPLVAGIDVAELAADGRLTRVAGFWGDLPAA